jgi:hypothetical protein
MKGAKEHHAKEAPNYVTINDDRRALQKAR